MPSFRIKSHMSSGNADFSTATKRKNFKITGINILHLRGCGEDINYHSLAEMFRRLDPRYNRCNPSAAGTTKSLEDPLLNLVSGALFSWPGDVALNS